MKCWYLVNFMFLRHSTQISTLQQFRYNLSMELQWKDAYKRILLKPEFPQKWFNYSFESKKHSFLLDVLDSELTGVQASLFFVLSLATWCKLFKLICLSMPSQILCYKTCVLGHIQSPKTILECFATQVGLFLSKFFTCNGPLMEPNHINLWSGPCNPWITLHNLQD